MNLNPNYYLANLNWYNARLKDADRHRMINLHIENHPYRLKAIEFWDKRIKFYVNKIHYNHTMLNCIYNLPHK